MWKASINGFGNVYAIDPRPDSAIRLFIFLNKNKQLSFYSLTIKRLFLAGICRLTLFIRLGSMLPCSEGPKTNSFDPA
jgi:hypothetical protein